MWSNTFNTHSRHDQTPGSDTKGNKQTTKKKLLGNPLLQPDPFWITSTCFKVPLSRGRRETNSNVLTDSMETQSNLV